MNKLVIRECQSWTELWSSSILNVLFSDSIPLSKNFLTLCQNGIGYWDPNKEKCRGEEALVYARSRLMLDTSSVIHSPHSPLCSISWMLTLRDVIWTRFLMFWLLVEISSGERYLEIREEGEEWGQGVNLPGSFPSGLLWAACNQGALSMQFSLSEFWQVLPLLAPQAKNVEALHSY